jgi:hypothetical protein
VDAIVLSGAGQVNVLLLIEKFDGVLKFEVLVDLIVILCLALCLVDLVQVGALFVVVLLGFLLRFGLFRHFLYMMICFSKLV